MPVHHTLKAWQHAQRLAVECVKAASRFPEYEQGALADQLRRACYSIPLNIAEGTSRKGTREYRRFLGTPRGAPAPGPTGPVNAPGVGDVAAAGYRRL